MEVLLFHYFQVALWICIILSLYLCLLMYQSSDASFLINGQKLWEGCNKNTLVWISQKTIGWRSRGGVGVVGASVSDLSILDCHFTYAKKQYSFFLSFSLISSKSPM